MAVRLVGSMLVLLPVLNGLVLLNRRLVAFFEGSYARTCRTQLLFRKILRSAAFIHRRPTHLSAQPRAKAESIKDTSSKTNIYDIGDSTLLISNDR